MRGGGGVIELRVDDSNKHPSKSLVPLNILAGGISKPGIAIRRYLVLSIEHPLMVFRCLNAGA